MVSYTHFHSHIKLIYINRHLPEMQKPECKRIPAFRYEVLKKFTTA